MSKRRPDVTSAPVAAAKAPTRTGIVFLAKELAGMQDSEFIIETNESDFFRWTVHMPETVMHDELKQDVHEWARRCNKEPIITLEVVYPSDYPISVPFVRVVRPRFVFHTGHVTVGGSLCTELLTRSGWMPMTPSALLHSVCVMFKDGRGRVDINGYASTQDYTEAEAKDAFTRVAQFHKWRV